MQKAYNLLKPWKSLDPWQKEYIKTEGNCFILCGRQSGKSAAMSIKFGKRAATMKNRTILMIAFTERQAYALFFKTLTYLEAVYPNKIKRGKDKPTKHIINLTNGSTIMCYAAGLKGEGIRTYTVTDLVIDEAAPMAREVFISCMPMLSVTGGSVDVSSTPKGKEGFFYDCSLRDDFTKFYVSARDCPRHKKKFLDSEQKNMSKLEFAQEYLAIFLDELRQIFSDKLIEKCMQVERRANIIKGNTHFLGVDIARMGKDESTFEILDRTNRDKIIQVENIITKKTLTTDTIQKIIDLDKAYKFRRIYIDDGGIGAAVFDALLLDSPVKKKVVALNNARRSLNRKGTDSKRLLKEDMYMNLLRLMESGKIKLLKDKEIALSLKSVQYEIDEKKRIRIFGSYTHIAEGLIRAAWCAQDKSLSIWVKY